VLLRKREIDVVKPITDGHINRGLEPKLDLTKHIASNYRLRLHNRPGVSRRLELMLRPKISAAPRSDLGVDRKLTAPDPGRLAPNVRGKILGPKSFTPQSSCY